MFGLSHLNNVIGESQYRRSWIVSWPSLSPRNCTQAMPFLPSGRRGCALSPWQADTDLMSALVPARWGGRCLRGASCPNPHWSEKENALFLFCSLVVLVFPVFCCLPASPFLCELITGVLSPCAPGRAWYLGAARDPAEPRTGPASLSSPRTIPLPPRRAIGHDRCLGLGRTFF